MRERKRQIGDDKVETKLIASGDEKEFSRYFSEICQAAKTGDQAKIDEFRQKKFFTLDVKAGFGFGLITPAGYLEATGDQQSANFLLQNGADVDFMGFGAGLKGDVTRAEFLRKNRGANPTSIARGAAWRGYYSYAEWLYAAHGADEFDILLGLITGGYYKKAVEFIERFNIQMHHLRESDFWMTVGMTAGRLTPELKKIYDAFDDDFLSATDPAYLHNIYLGAGLSGNYKIDTGVSEPLRNSFYRGMIQGGHLSDLPEAIYQAKQDDHTIFGLYDAMTGCNLDYLDHCLAVNKNDRAAMREYDSDLDYAVTHSNDLSLIDALPKPSYLLFDLLRYGHRPREFSYLYFWEHSYKMLSHIFKTRNQNFLDKLGAFDFIHLLPNEDMATHLLSFDYNYAFQSKLLERFDAVDWSHWTYKRHHYDFHRAYTNASKIRTLMQKYKFNYDQAYAVVVYPDLRNFLFNTYKDVTAYMNRDICALIASELGHLQVPDVSDLIDKLRYHRHTIQEILHIADGFKQYAATHETEQGKHAASLADVLAKTRKNTEVVDLLSHELQMLQDAKDKAAAPAPSGFSALMQSTAGFFSAAAGKAKGLYQTDSTPAHEKTYQSTGDDGYEVMVRNAMTSCMKS